MIADAVPPARGLATKADVEAVRADLIDRIEGSRADLIDRIGRTESRVFRAGLLFFLPMWVSVWGALLVVLLQL